MPHMATKGKPELESVKHSVTWEGDLWADMQGEIDRLLVVEHRNVAVAEFIREVMRKHLAAVRQQLANVA